MVGGGPSLRGSGHATVIEGKVADGKLTVTVHNLADGSVKEAHTFAPRKKR